MSYASGWIQTYLHGIMLSFERIHIIVKDPMGSEDSPINTLTVDWKHIQSLRRVQDGCQFPLSLIEFRMSSLLERSLSSMSSMSSMSEGKSWNWNRYEAEIIQSFLSLFQLVMRKVPPSVEVCRLTATLRVFHATVTSVVKCLEEEPSSIVILNEACAYSKWLKVRIG